MKTLRPFWLLLLCVQFLPAQSTFTKPSEAYEFARRPLTEWQAALDAHREPATSIAPESLVRQRFAELCPSFMLGSVSGEELYWLAKLCEQNREKALQAVELYLAGDELTHGPDARLVLARLQVRRTGSWEAAWGTIRTILQEDPMQPVESQIDVIIDDEADTDPKMALDWSKERYAILRDRNQTANPGVPLVESGLVLHTGCDLVHRYYLAGETDEAAKILAEMNRFLKSHPGEATGWGARDLHWANLEMHPAPPVAVVKLLGRSSPSGVAQPGRVEVISFFFLGCSPCMRELPHLDALQKRYGEKKLLVTDVTTYKMNSYLSASSDSSIEATVEKARLEKAPHIGVVITSDETLESYGINGVPVVVIVDKRGRIRKVGFDIDFEDGDSAGRLIHKLLEE